MKREHLTFGDISDLHDGAVASARRRDVLMKHLDECEECRREHESFKRLLRLLNGLAAYGITDRETFLRDALERIKQRSGASSQRRILWKSLAGLAAAVLIIIAVAIGGGIVDQYKTTDSVIRDRGITATIDHDDDDDYLYPANGNSLIMQVILSNNASINRITRRYIDGEISAYDYDDLVIDLSRSRYPREQDRARLRRPVSEVAFKADQQSSPDWNLTTLSRQGSMIYFRVQVKGAK